MSEPKATTASPEQVDRLIASAEQQTEAADRFSMSMVAHQERARTATRRFRIQMVVIILGLAGLYARQEIANNASTDTRNRIVDCVDPSGQCAKRSAAQTAQIIAQLNQYNLYVGVCATRYTHLTVPAAAAATAACVVKYLPPR